MSKLSPEGWGPSIEIVCTDRGIHKRRKLGETQAGGIVVTIGGPKDRRQPSPRGPGISKHPEPCPICRRTARKTREEWMQIFELCAAKGVSRFDISDPQL